jgi:hypothetical protein
VQERIDVRGGQLVEGAVAAARVVDDERVERAERLARRGDDAAGCIRIREVGLEVRREVVAAPRLRGVVGRPAVREDPRAARMQAARDREADAGPAGDAGDERGSQVVRTPTTSRTASLLARSASVSSSERSSSTICSIPCGPSFTGTPM